MDGEFPERCYGNYSNCVLWLRNNFFLTETIFTIALIETADESYKGICSRDKWGILNVSLIK